MEFFQLLYGDPDYDFFPHPLSYTMIRFTHQFKSKPNMCSTPRGKSTKSKRPTSGLSGEMDYADYAAAMVRRSNESFERRQRDRQQQDSKSVVSPGTSIESDINIANRV